MNKLLGKTWLKVLAAVVLCIVAPLTVAVGAGAGILLDAEEDFTQPADFPASSLCYAPALSDASQLVHAVQNGWYNKDTYTVPRNFTYILRDQRGRLIADTTTAYSQPTVTGLFDQESYAFEMSADFTESAYDGWFDNAYQLECFVDMPIARSSGYFANYLLYAALCQGAGLFVPLALAGLALSVLLFVFLMRAAGRREGEDGVVLRGLNRLPIDLYALVLIIAGGCFLAVGVEASYYALDYLLGLLQLALCLEAAGVCLLLLCLTCAARFKAGKWWRNSVLWWLGSTGKRLAGQLFGVLPVMWKLILVFCVFVFGDLILFIMMFNGDGLLILLALLMAAGWNAFALGLLVAVGLQLRRLQQAGQALAAGDLSYQLDTSKLFFDFRQHGEDLNHISEGVNRAVEERMKSERFKTELITNVSHDLKTPLTAIVSYVDLLKKEPLDNEQARAYIAVLERQSAKLKKLTEDLVEASKASSGAMAVEKERLDLRELVSQCVGEYGERLSAAALEPVTDLPEQPVYIMADSRLLGRVLDNLLQNVVKYALPHTRVYLTLERQAGKVLLSVKNISREQLGVSADLLLERFVRGDAARSGEGSGLGLSIANSLTALTGGELALKPDGDLFKVVLSFDEAAE